MPSCCKIVGPATDAHEAYMAGLELGNPELSVSSVCRCFGVSKTGILKPGQLVVLARVGVPKPRLQLVDRDIRFFLRAFGSVLS